MVKIIIGVLLIAWGVGALLHISIIQFIFALILIAFGVKLITGERKERVTDPKISREPSTENKINEVNIFSVVEKSIRSDNFKGGKIVMIFSGGKIDLSDSKTMEKSIDLETISIFGGLEIVIPKNWKIGSQGTSILGGFDIKTNEGDSENTLNIKGLALFGGVKITN